MSNVEKTFRFNAIMEGIVSNAGGLARGSILVFDSNQFTATINAAASTPSQFLLGADGLSDLASNTSNISLARFFPPPALLASDFQTPLFPTGVVSSVPLDSGLITVQPGDAVTVLFDIAVYSPSNGGVNFGDTLKSAPNFITDVNGQIVPEIVAVGPSKPVAPAPTSIALSPSSATTPINQLHTVSALVTANGNPVGDAKITFTVTSGPNTGRAGTTSTDEFGKASFSYTSSAIGTDTIGAAVGALPSAAVQNAWTFGPLDHISISPANATIAAGGTRAYTALGFDAFNNGLGDVTSSTTFTIAPNGSCTGAVCTASTAGAHTVTGNDGGKTATAALDLTGATGNYAFQGFFWLLDAPSHGIAWNLAGAGLPAPILWRLTRNSQPIADRASFVGLFSYPVNCTTGAGSSSAAVQATGATNPALWYWGQGLWEYNWKVPVSYKNTCRAMFVTFNDGTSSPTEYFKFK